MRQDLVIKKPIISEKSMQAAAAGRYTFQADVKASKDQIAASIEKLFDVNVISVATTIVKGKIKKYGSKRRPAKLSNYKKAIITLKKGQTIDIFNFEENK